MIVSRNKLLLLSSSFFLALVLAFIPWDIIRSQNYYDRNNYINYIDFYDNKVNWFDFSTLQLKITYEWGWHYIIDFFSNNLKLNSSIILFSISFFFLFIVLYIMFYNKKLLGVLFILNPAFIDFFFSQIRLTFAISFVYLSLFIFNRNKYLAIILATSTIFIHTSTILFIFIFYSGLLLSENTIIPKRLKYILAILVGSIVAIITGPYMSIILKSLDDRRAEYNDMASPLLYVIFWVVFYFYILIKVMIEKTNIYNRNYIYISLSILTVVVLNSFIAGYSSRFLVASFPFIILSLVNFKGSEVRFLWLGYILYLALLWIFWVT